MSRRWLSVLVLAGLALGAMIVYACTTEKFIAPDASLDSLYIEPASAVLVVDDTLHLTAVGIDTSGHPFVDTRVRWSSPDPTIKLTANGTAIGLALGTATVTATAGGHNATALLVIQPKPAFATSRDSVAFNAFANGPNPAATTVTITNGGGGTLTPAIDSVHYAPGPAGWLQALISQGGASGTDTLKLSVTTSSIAVGTYTANVFMSSAKAAPKMIKVIFVVGVDAPFAMTIDSGNAQTATVNSAVPIRPSVLIHDRYNNVVPNAAVTFAITGGGGSVAPTTAVMTDANGRARVTSWTLGTAAGPNSLQAQTSGVAPVTFTATGTAAAPAATAKTAGDTQSVTVNTAVPFQPTVRVTDQFGNPVESVTVTFNVASGGGSLTGATKKTDVSGLAAVGSWTVGKVAGANTLTATAAGLPATTFSATGTADVADSLTLSGGNNQTDTVKATLATAYTVRVADQYGNPVAGKTVTWGVSGGGSITPTSITNGSGIASATRVFGTVAGPQGALATVAGLIGSPVAFSATATHGAATTIQKFAGDGQSATAGSAVAIAPVAKVVDQYGNPVSGVNVTFSVTAGGGSVAPTTAIATDTAGKAAVTSWTLGPTAGANNNTLTASASGLTSVGFVASGLSGAAKNLVYVSGDAQTDTIGASRSYTVKVTDSNNNPVQGITVSWVVTVGGGSITASSVTDVNGLANATRVFGTTVGLDSATASVGGLTGSPRGFVATVQHGNASQIVKTAGDGQSATVNTTVTTAPQVKITDRANNPIQSASVTFSVTAGGGSISPASPATLSTDVNGLAQLTSWTVGTIAGGNTVSATSTGTPGASFSATGTPDVPSASQSTLTGNVATITACSVSCTVAGATADSVTVTVKDQFGNLVSGANVVVSSTGTGNGFSPAASGTSSASGVFATKVNSTVAEGKTISATANGTGVTQTAGVTVNPAGVSASTSTVAAGTASITACSTSCVAGSTASTITITVRDQFSNVISGASVTPASTGSGNTLSPSSGTTNGAGVFTTTLNSTVAESKTMSATANAVGITQTAGVTVNAAAPASVTVVNQAQKARVGTGISVLPTFTVRDAFSNLVTGFAVTIAAGGSGSLLPTSTTTNGSGQVTLTSWTMGASATEVAGGMINTATLTAGAASGVATDTGFYSWSLDVNALIGTTSTCSGCHVFAQNGYGGEVNVAAACNAAYNLIQPSSAGASMIYLKLINAQPAGCGVQMPPGGPFYNAAQLKIVRTWINRSALNN